MTETLQEFCDSRGVAMRVDRQAGVIRGAKILGLRSRNGRAYLPETLKQAATLYEDAKVNVNHPKGNPNAPRDYRDRIGVIRSVAVRPGEGLFADFHFNPKHALAERRDEENRDERESLWSSGDLIQDLKDGLQRALDGLRNLGRRDGRGQRSAESIRKMYASVIDMAEEAGYPRDQAETPYEHTRILYQAFPGGDDAVDAITEAYVRVHYGEVPDTREEMDQLRRYYRELQAAVTPNAEE